MATDSTSQYKDIIPKGNGSLACQRTGSGSSSRGALESLWQLYGGNVTDEVLEVIENDPKLLAEYHDIASGFDGGTESLNQNIGEFVKAITGRRLLSQGNPWSYS